MSEFEQLYRQEQSARQEAVRLAQRTSRLQSVTAALSTASTVAQACEVVVVQGAAALEAGTAGLWLTDPDGQMARLVRSVDYPAANIERFGAIPLHGPQRVPVAETLTTGEPVWLSSRDELVASYPQVAARVQRPELAIACLPMVVDDRCVGAVAFSFDDARVFSPGDKQFLLVLARLCAQAIERARLYDLEKTARAEAEAAQRRTALLLEASLILSSSLACRDNLQRVAQLVVGRVADWCVIEPASEADRQVAPLAIAHADPERLPLLQRWRRDAPDGLAWQAATNVLRTGAPELHRELSGEAR